MTTIWITVSDQPVSSSPRMLMNVNTAMMPTPTSQRSRLVRLSWLWM